MAETQKFSQENGRESEKNNAEIKRISQANLEKVRLTAEKAKNKHLERLDELQKEALEKATEAKEVISTELESENTDRDQPGTILPELQNETRRRTLVRIQKQLPPQERVLSKAIHNPVIEKISDAAGSTVARPMGILYGGLFSLISSGLLLYITRHYGYEYSYALLIVSFVVGYAIGLIVEAMIKLAFRKR